MRSDLFRSVLVAFQHHSYMQHISLSFCLRFHCYNGTRQSESVPPGSQLADDDLFARPPDARTPKVNHFTEYILLLQRKNNLYLFQFFNIVMIF